MIDANTTRIALVGALCFGLLIGSFIGAALERRRLNRARVQDRLAKCCGEQRRVEIASMTKKRFHLVKEPK